VIVLPNTFTLIASATAGSGGAASLDFTSIPSTYTDLCVKISARSAGTDGDSFFTINGSSANFTYRRLEGNGTSATSISSTGGFWGNIPTSSQTASTFSNTELYIPNYAGSTNKSFQADGVAENNATLAYMRLVAGLWSQTSAITSLSFSTYGANLAQYTTAYLYGIVKS
jgi:hypothetical protein